MSETKPSRTQKFREAVADGTVQQMIDAKWFQQDITRHFGVSVNTLRPYVKDGTLKFAKAKTYTRRTDDPTFEEKLTPMRRLALCEVWK